MTFTGKFEFYWSLAKATGLTDTEFRVLVLLANYADGKTGRRAFPSAETLAEQMGKSAKTVRRSLAALVAYGWLVKIDRPGKTSEYTLSTPSTLDTQMSRVTENHPGHSDVQGPDPTLDKSDPTLDIAMSTHPGHLDVQRSDQGSDPSRIRSVTDGSDHRGQDIRDVQPADDQDETGLGSRSLAVEGREATEEVADRRAGGTALGAEPATETEGAPEAPEGLVGLQPPTAAGSSFDDPFANSGTWWAEVREREERAVRVLEPETATKDLDCGCSQTWSGPFCDTWHRD